MRSRPVSSPTRQLLALPRPDVIVTQIDAHMPTGPIQATYEDSTILSPSLGIRKVPDENFPTKHLTKSQSVPVLSKTNTGLRSSILTADLKDTFSTHRSRVHYGSRVALELSNGHLLTIQSPNGRVCISDPKVNERDEVSKMTISPKKQITVFTLVHLTDTQTTAELHFGDPVWLKISSGKGEEGWEHGGVLGVNVRQMPKLKLAASRHSTSAMVVGTPSPLAAYVPKHRDFIELEEEIAQCQKRNNSSALLGKWIIRSARRDCIKADMHLDFVCNFDEIFFEQNWFYLGASFRTEDAILRPIAEQDNMLYDREDVSSDMSQIWRIRLFDQQDVNENRFTLKQQQRERLLLKARRQLLRSREGRSRHGRSELIQKPSSRQLAELAISSSSDTFAQKWKKHLAPVILNLDPASQRTRLEALVRCDDAFDPVCTLEGDTSDSDRHLNTGRRLDASNPQMCGLCRSSSMGYALCYQTQETCMEISSTSECRITSLMQHEDKKMAGIIRSKMEKCLTVESKQKQLTMHPD